MSTTVNRNTEIVKAYNGGETLRSLSSKYNISTERVRQILEKRNVLMRTRGRPVTKEYKPKFGKLTPRERFMQNIQETAQGDHWIWTKGNRKYGTWGLNGKVVYAQQAAYYFTHGKLPSRRLRKQCSVERCVNPEHWS